jgi:hypothetical protein
LEFGPYDRILAQDKTCTFQLRARAESKFAVVHRQRDSHSTLELLAIDVVGPIDQKPRTGLFRS